MHYFDRSVLSFLQESTDLKFKTILYLYFKTYTILHALSYKMKQCICWGLFWYFLIKWLFSTDRRTVHVVVDTRRLIKYFKQRLNLKLASVSYLKQTLHNHRTPTLAVCIIRDQSLFKLEGGGGEIGGTNVAHLK
jgi:hypothetical protein